MKICDSCNKKFDYSGKICKKCYDKKRRQIPEIKLRDARLHCFKRLNRIYIRLERYQKMFPELEIKYKTPPQNNP